MKTYKLSDITGMAESMSKMENWMNTTGKLYAATWGLEVGKLPGEYVDSFDKCNYAVYSYETPIVWLMNDGGWMVPTVFYSVSTSRHLAIIRQAIAHLTAG